MKHTIKRAVLYIAGSAVILAVATVLELLFMRLETRTIGGKLLFLLLLNLNVLALSWLVVVVGRHLVRLAVERRKGVRGHKFKTKIVAFFVVLISIPSGLLFVVASGLGANYIDRFFTPQFRQPIESSLRMAKTVYDMERKRALRYAEAASAGYSLPPGYVLMFMKEMPEEPSASVRAAFEGRKETEVISSPDGDIVRAAVPLSPEDPWGGVLIVQTLVNQGITQSIESMKTAYEDYIHLEAWRAPLKLNYLLLLGFFSLIIIFAALWVSLKIAGWITEPVKGLSHATEEVARGNLDVSVKSSRQDELGLLVESFNRMVREMKQDKESLERAYQNLENIVSNIQSGVITLDGEGFVRQINASACEVLNISSGDVMGRNYSELLSGISSEELQKVIKGINLRTFKNLDQEVWIEKGGIKVLLRVSIISLRDAGGEHLGLLVVLDDLTEFVKAQRALAWQEVARRLAHEIKNPLTPIKLSTERMLKKWQKKDPAFDRIFERSSETIIREVDGLKRLVDEFSRLGKMPVIKRVPTALGPMVKEVATLYRDYKDLEIQVDVPGEMPLALLDSEQFKRVLINLFDNAIEAMQNKGRIKVNVGMKDENDRFFISVADEGSGIKDEHKDRLFQPYFSTKEDGTGLGLAIAHRIVDEHGGSIRVKDNSPRGIVFTVELPAKEA
jgi:two-component system nitrogen regulation sensor histidine kinase NtrY